MGKKKVTEQKLVWSILGQWNVHLHLRLILCKSFRNLAVATAVAWVNRLWKINPSRQLTSNCNVTLLSGGVHLLYLCYTHFNGKREEEKWFDFDFNLLWLGGGGGLFPECTNRVAGRCLLNISTEISKSVFNDILVAVGFHSSWMC